MKNTIRCCISCILPCGALDVIRIVHSNGHVEELSGTIRASEIMKAHPKHVLKKPSSPSHDDDDGLVPKVVIVPPDAQLRRGKIYFLIPAPPPPPPPPGKASKSRHRKRRESGRVDGGETILMPNAVVSDRYLSEIMSEKASSTQKERRRGRVGVWRPHLERICESPN